MNKFNFIMSSDSEYDYYSSDDNDYSSIFEHSINIPGVNIEYINNNEVRVGKVNVSVEIKLINKCFYITKVDTDSSCYKWIINDRFKNKPFTNINTLLNKIFNTLSSSLEHCIICDERLPCKVERETVCSNDICIYQMSVLGLGVSLESLLIHSFETVEILIKMYIDASHSGNNIFVDKPIFVENDVAQLDLHQLVDYAIKGSLRKELYKINPDIYNVLQWIVTGNRCTLTHVPGNIKKFNVSIPPEKKAIFEKNSKQYGTIYLFHGSASHCWFNIIRHGLKIMSGTKYMTTGAAYGNGVYLSKDLSVALQYAHGSCIAICEVINRYKVTNYCCVVTREEDIRIHSLMVGEYPPSSVDISTLI